MKNAGRKVYFGRPGFIRKRNLLTGQLVE